MNLWQGDGLQLRIPDGLTPAAPVVLLIGETGSELDALASMVEKRRLDCGLCGVTVENWNDQLSPWPGPAAFRGGGTFGGGADAFLSELQAAIPEVERQTGGRSLCIAGYSLAGLFALYAATRTDRFAGVASMSGSTWYAGFDEYLRAHPPANPRTGFYLSLGRAEERTRNPALRPVGDRTRWIRQFLSETQGQDVPLAMHDGGHYANVPERILAGIEWLAKNGRAQL